MATRPGGHADVREERNRKKQNPDTEHGKGRLSRKKSRKLGKMNSAGRRERAGTEDLTGKWQVPRDRRAKACKGKRNDDSGGAHLL